MNATKHANKYDTSATEQIIGSSKVRDKIRFKHYSLSAENTYLSWIKQIILYHGKRHPADMGAAAVETFLTYLATQRL